VEFLFFDASRRMRLGITLQCIFFFFFITKGDINPISATLA
jgi:hypothetical protein